MSPTLVNSIPSQRACPEEGLFECSADCGTPRPYEMANEKDANSGEHDWHEHVLPGCSKGYAHNTEWNVSTSMMQAYLFMKGPGTDMEDPLLVWMSKQEEENLEEGECGLLDGINDSIKEQADWKVSGVARYDEEDRQASFHYPRPKINHITLNESFDSDALEEFYRIRDKQNDGWAQYAASDISDGEGNPADGRISPCTFLRWVDGAKRWDTPGDKYKSKWEARQTYDIPEARQRPPSPNTLEPRELKQRETEAQFDEHDGRPLTAACSEFAYTEPSVLWSPPPMKAALPADSYHYKINLMDPELSKALRDGVTSPMPSWGVVSAEEPEEYSRSEIDGAVERYWGLAHTTNMITEKHYELAFLKHNEEQVNASNERYRHEIRRLKHENRKLGDCLTLRRSVRDRRIMKEVHRHVRDLDYENRVKLAEVKARWKENEQLRCEYEAMRGVQEWLLTEFGKDTPNEVFEMFPTVWESLETRKNRRNFS